MRKLYWWESFEIQLPDVSVREGEPQNPYCLCRPHSLCNFRNPRPGDIQVTRSQKYKHHCSKIYVGLTMKMSWKLQMLQLVCWWMQLDSLMQLFWWRVANGTGYQLFSMPDSRCRLLPGFPPPPRHCCKCNPPKHKEAAARATPRTMGNVVAIASRSSCTWQPLMIKRLHLPWFVATL